MAKAAYSNFHAYGQGNVGRDPRVISGREASTTVVVFPVALQAVDIDRNGNEVEYTQWIDVKVFGFNAEAALSNISKGDSVTFAPTPMFPTKYEKDGEVFWGWEIRPREGVNKRIFPDNNRGDSRGDSRGSGGNSRRRQTDRTPENDPWGDEDFGDELGDDFEEEAPRKRRPANTRRGGAGGNSRRRRAADASVDGDVDDYLDPEIL